MLPEYGAGDETALRSHLSLVHGVHVKDEKTVEGLLDCHQADHGPLRFGVRDIRHEHLAALNPPDELAEWSWE